MTFAELYYCVSQGSYLISPYRHLSLLQFGVGYLLWKLRFLMKSRKPIKFHFCLGYFLVVRLSLILLLSPCVSINFRILARIELLGYTDDILICNKTACHELLVSSFTFVRKSCLCSMTRLWPYHIQNPKLNIWSLGPWLVWGQYMPGSNKKNGNHIR